MIFDFQFRFNARLSIITFNCQEYSCKIFPKQKKNHVNYNRMFRQADITDQHFLKDLI